MLTLTGELREYTRYNLETWLLPLWGAREIYNETFMFVGEEDSPSFLYQPEEIIAVRNYGLDTEYREGKDYRISGGRIQRLKGSAIPFFSLDEFYRTESDTVGIAVVPDRAVQRFPEKRYLKYGEGDTFTSRQIAVTYRHGGKWDGTVSSRADFSGFRGKLKSGRAKIVFFGDSITVGCNASGTQYGGNTAPHTPAWTDMMCDYIRLKFFAQVDCVNTAVGGFTSANGCEIFDDAVIKHKPDLLVLAFGMNDGGLTAGQYRTNISDMTGRLRAALPETEILLVSTMLPNEECDWLGNHEAFEHELLNIAAGDQSIAVAPVTSMYKGLLRKKRTRDMTGNNVNHPNDFAVRLYAQTALEVLVGL